MDEASFSGQRCPRERREKFLAEILKSEREKSTHLNVLIKDKYLELIQEAQKLEKRTPLQQRRLKRFNVVEIGGIKNSSQEMKKMKI